MSSCDGEGEKGRRGKEGSHVEDRIREGWFCLDTKWQTQISHSEL